jgi:cytochrome c
MRGLRRVLASLMLLSAGFFAGFHAAPRLTPAPGDVPLRRGGIARAHVFLLIGAAALASAIAIAIWRTSETLEAQAIARALTGGEPSRAPALMIRFGCTGCHTIPGVPGADGKVGPALSGLRQRVFIGDGVRNTAPLLIQWITDPRSLSPQTAMPVTGISERQARDVAAFLYSH